MNSMFRYLSSVAAISLSVPAFAQDTAATQDESQVSTPTPEATTPPDGGLGEIIVTAQRRNERLQDVPVSVQVVTGQQLAEQNRNSLESLTRTVPGVKVTSGGTFANALYVRGIGSSGNPAFDQSVATFIDGVYFGRSRATGATFLDLDRIEVLKGPQTTYFGNNAIAGALNIITRRPGREIDGFVRALYGEHGQYAVEAASTAPLGETVSLRVAGILEGGRGWIRNENTGDLAPERRNAAGRATLAFDPSDAFDATLKVEAARNRTYGTDLGLPQQWDNCPAPAPIGANAGGVFCNQAIAAGVPRDIRGNRNSGLPGQGTKLDTYGGVLTMNYRVADLTLTSATAYIDYNYLARGDQIGFDYWLNTHQQTERYNQFSQEFRVTSPTGGTIEYLAGVYFQADGLYQDFDINAPFTNALAPLVGVPAQYLPLAWDPGFNQREHVWSGFGALTWNVIDRLKITGGLRWTRVDKRFRGFNRYGQAQQYYGYLPIPADVEARWSVVQGPPGRTDLSRKDQQWQPSARIQYEIAPDIMVYGSYSKGFKAGGYNGVVPVGAPENLQFGPEKVDAFEVGLKSKLFDNRVLFNLSLFRSEYKDLQVDASVFLPGINGYSIVVRNAATSRAQGAEIEAQWAVTDDFRIEANVTYLDSKYLSYPNASPTSLQNYCRGNYVEPFCNIFPRPVPQFRDLSGGRTRFAPEWSASINARYGIDLGSDLRLTAEVSPYITSSYNVEEEPYVRGTHGYLRLDGRLTLAQLAQGWSVDLIGKNLTDRVIIATAAIYVAQKEEPRNIALQLRYRW